MIYLVRVKVYNCINADFLLLGSDCSVFIFVRCCVRVGRGKNKLRRAWSRGLQPYLSTSFTVLKREGGSFSLSYAYADGTTRVSNSTDAMGSIKILV